MKRMIRLSVILCLLLVGIFHFCYYPCKIGSPQGAEICYTDANLRQRKAITLNTEQTEQLAAVLKNATPTIFVHDSPGMGSEDILITLHYADGTSKTVSLWHARSILYEGDAEEMTMAAMLGGGILHFGGDLDADKIQDILRRAGVNAEGL